METNTKRFKKFADKIEFHMSSEELQWFLFLIDPPGLDPVSCKGWFGSDLDQEGEDALGMILD